MDTDKRELAAKAEGKKEKRKKENESDRVGIGGKAIDGT